MGTDTGLLSDNLTPVENLVVADSVHGVAVNSGVTLKARHLTLKGNEVGVAGRPGQRGPDQYDPGR